MDAKFWYEVWEQGRLGFHQKRPNPQLRAYWPQLELHGRGRVLVPLAGKSRDMLWLRDQGHDVLGIELSEIAVRAFFAENDLPFEITEQDGFQCFQSGGLALWCGDFFGLTPEIIVEAGITAVYDRAALIALPADLRARYTAHMAAILPTDTKMLLLAIEYSQAEMQGPPFSVTDQEVRDSYDHDFYLTQLHQHNALEKDRRLRHFLSSLTENVYLLEKR
jgi:thiopurine S-methyltransferase